MINTATRLVQFLGRRDAVVGINRRNVELVYPHNPRRHYPIADDKLLAKRYLQQGGVPVLDNLAVCGTLGGIAQFVSDLSDREQFVIKPARSSGGRGLVVVGARAADGSWITASGTSITSQELGRHAANVVYGVYSKDRADFVFAEPRVVPHPVFADLWSRGLCDVRVITLHGKPMMSMVRVPTQRSAGRANLHQGGLGLAVDLDTGSVSRAVHRGRTISRHPESQAALLGLQVPEWSQILEISRRAADSVPLQYLGIDVVVDAQGRCWVLEINVRPGLEIQNVNGRPLGRALEQLA